MYAKIDTYIEKANGLADGELVFTVSTNALDAQGQRINVDGINVKEYMKNPVVLWGHDGFNLPIARTSKVWKENGKLMAKAKFYLKDAFASKVYNYIVDGYLNAVSIAGMVDEWANDGLTIAKMTMKEFSVVTIPANPEALVAQKSLDGGQVAELRGLANSYARSILESEMGETLVQKNISVLETLVASLKELAVGETHDVESAKSVTDRRVVLKQAQVVDQQVETVIKSIKLKG